MRIFITLFAFVHLFACTNPTEVPTAKKVEIAKTDNKYHLTIDGVPYQVKGVGLDFRVGKNFKALKEAGGNAFRTWRTENAIQQLDSAAKYGFMVAMGLDIHKELHGFDYNDEVAVAKQFERIKKEVLALKDNPNLLCWVAGNELNLLFNDEGGLATVNPKVYDALSDIVDFIHEVDPNHPVTTTFAGVHKDHVKVALERCPQIDFLAVQVYGDLKYLPVLIKNTPIEMPFMVTEFGARGHWEMPTTAWGREIEAPSTVKALDLSTNIQKGIVEDTSGLNMGSFAFMWGQKQERTPTWYGMFNKSGEPTSRVDELTKYWTGSYPANRAPNVDSILLDGKKAVDNVYLKPNGKYSVEVFASDPDQDSLRINWVILKEVEVRSEGGAFEKEPEEVAFKTIEVNGGMLQFEAPASIGDYRIFAYVYDNNGKVGNANVPFYVNE